MLVNFRLVNFSAKYNHVNIGCIAVSQFYTTMTTAIFEGRLQNRNSQLCHLSSISRLILVTPSKYNCADLLQCKQSCQILWPWPYKTEEAIPFLMRHLPCWVVSMPQWIRPCDYYSFTYTQQKSLFGSNWKSQSTKFSRYHTQHQWVDCAWYGAVNLMLI